MCLTLNLTVTKCNENFLLELSLLTSHASGYSHVWEGGLGGEKVYCYLFSCLRVINPSLPCFFFGVLSNWRVLNL